MNKSILIGWTSPDCPPGQIEMYHVYVDGFLRTTVRATDKTKALVEGVDNARVSYDAQRAFKNAEKSASLFWTNTPFRRNYFLKVDVDLAIKAISVVSLLP